ncbi:hypothetical protein [Paenibacillus sp. YN15]|uniref:hypothetical protein n=1 Tax=Paenibacillus sp. YN15 TaxID=1742774 RepID=UPI000DCDBCC5|nr:hypothetical protein [Paenibacillus sp. YN15]RAU96808.1 hypothetical protein DQG13_19830 [Paenibacillus sp. YN15]
MAKINVILCPKCGRDLHTKYYRYCGECDTRGVSAQREKKRIDFAELTVVDWFSSRSSAGLTLQDAEGKRYSVYMSDIFRYLDGTKIANVALEETKKGSAYGWRVIAKENEEEAQV